MKHTRLNAMPCPIARGLDRVGEWWSILILRDAFHGKTRFDQFRKSLGIAPNILSRRLRGLVEAGLLQKVRYHECPARDEYVLTEVGRDFRPVLWAMLAWGTKHFMADGPDAVRAVAPACPSNADPRADLNHQDRRQS
jgi:DNA-binding HxlR family transcriptional regulator